jgi:hypothetical protein
MVSKLRDRSLFTLLPLENLRNCFCFHSHFWHITAKHHTGHMSPLSNLPSHFILFLWYGNNLCLSPLFTCGHFLSQSTQCIGTRKCQNLFFSIFSIFGFLNYILENTICEKTIGSCPNRSRKCPTFVFLGVFWQGIQNWEKNDKSGSL